MGADAAECSFFFLNVMAGVFLFLITIPTAVVAIIAYIIAATHWDSTCSSGWMPLQTWLVVNSTLSTGYIVGGFVLLGLYCHLNRKSFSAWFVLATLLIVPTKLIWNIIGTVALATRGGDCLKDESSLWSMTLAFLIIQWIIIGVSVVLLGCKCCCRSKSDDEPTFQRKEALNPSV
jgi:hypothetical protein